MGPGWLRNHTPGEISVPLFLEFSTEVVALSDSPTGVWTAVEPQRTSSTGGDSGNGSADEREAGWPLYVKLSNGRCWGVDVVVSATGVEPAVGFMDSSFPRGSDGALIVDEQMRTVGCPSVFAAGDACSTEAWPSKPHWFQMRLWSQARAMGLHAARCMAGESDELGAGVAFDIFAHTTTFFGKKVVLLGQYNAQHLSLGEGKEQEAKEQSASHVAQTAVVTENGFIGTVSSSSPALHTYPSEAARQVAQGHVPPGFAMPRADDDPHAEQSSRKRRLASGEDGRQDEVEFLTRVTPGSDSEYVKVVVKGMLDLSLILVLNTDQHGPQHHPHRHPKLQEAGCTGRCWWATPS